MTPDNLLHPGGGHDDDHSAFPSVVKYTVNRIKWTPAVDIYETETEVIAVAEIPGVKPEDIRISFQNSVLKIEGVKNKVSEMKCMSYFFVERAYGRFERKFRIVSPVDKKQIEASFDNGVLTIMLPKK